MSYLDDLNSEYSSLLSGKIQSPSKNIVNETEKLFFSNEEAYLRKYLGVLYLFSGKKLLAYSLLKEENDEISRFYFLNSLIALGYRSEALHYYESWNQNRFFQNANISIRQRIRLAFLLGISISIRYYDDNDDVTKALSLLLYDFSSNSCNEKICDIIYKTNDQLLINELKRRKKDPQTCPDLFVHEHFFKDDFFEISSYSTEIGNNMYLLKINGESIIVDCGASTKNPEINFDKFFSDNNVSKSDIKAIFFTHSHLDHIGNAKKLLNYLDNDVCYYLTIDTQSLANYGNQVYLDDRNLRYISYNTTASITDNITVTFIQNGHILGSTALIFNCNGKKMLFTSDFCLHDQTTIVGMNLNQVESYVGNHIDYLVSESTYGKKTTRLQYDDYVELFCTLVSTLRKYNKKIFIPAYAIGRSQEIINYLTENGEENNNAINILGKANNVSLHYQILEKCPNIKWYSDHDTPFIYDIIIASSGMLIEESESNTLVHRILDLNEKNIAFVQTGYIPPNEEGRKLIDEWKKAGLLYFDVGLSAHASNKELHKLIESFKIDNIISIHGNGID